MGVRRPLTAPQEPGPIVTRFHSAAPIPAPCGFPKRLEARRLSHDYRDGLLELFFDQKSGLFNLTKNYGVF